MSADILDLIMAQIEEQKGQDYVEYVLPSHRVRPGPSSHALYSCSESLHVANAQCNI